MAFGYRIESGKRFIWSEWNGVFSTDDVIIHTETILSDPRYHPDFRGVSDVRHADWQFVDDSVLRIHEFVSNHPRHPTGPWAILCAKPLQTAYAMIYESVITPVHPVKVFSTETAAMEWLDEFINMHA